MKRMNPKTSLMTAMGVVPKTAHAMTNAQSSAMTASSDAACPLSSRVGGQCSQGSLFAGD